MCSLEFPDIERTLVSRYKDRGLVVVGINPGKIMMGGESPAMVEMFARQTSISFPLGFDKGTSYKYFPYGDAISPFPLDVLIDQKGRIVYAKRKYDAAALTRAVEQLLGK